MASMNRESRFLMACITICLVWATANAQPSLTGSFWYGGNEVTQITVAPISTFWVEVHAQLTGAPVSIGGYHLDFSPSLPQLPFLQWTDSRGWYVDSTTYPTISSYGSPVLIPPPGGMITLGTGRFRAPLAVGTYMLSIEPNVSALFDEYSGDVFGNWTPLTVVVQSSTTVATPAFSPDGGVYDADQQVVVTCSTADAVIHYTTDGSEPTEVDPVVTSGSSVSVVVASPTTLKAKAFRTNWTASGVKTATYRRPQPIFVSTTGNDSNDGLSWGEAKRTVQAGLNTATSEDQVWVSQGTYVEQITLKMGLALYGGFAGGETDLAQRNWSTNPTILDGNSGGTVVTSPAGATTTTRIDGFTIRNGNASNGGGIYCYSSSPTIANNEIIDNTVYGGFQASDCSSGYGGGIYAENASPVITGNVIARNQANGCEWDQMFDPEQPPNRVWNPGHGGGIYVSGGSPMIANNIITGNTANSYSYYAGGSGGGLYCGPYSSPTIANNTITGNTAGYGSGGGIYCSGSSSPMIAGNRITGNSAGYAGGGIYCYYCSPTIANNMITANSLSGFSDALGGGIYCSFSSPTIANNTITVNSASYGGGVYCSSSSSPTIANNTITTNSARSYGGGIYCDSSSAPTIANTIIAFNSSGLYKVAGTGAPVLRYNCVYGNTTDNYSGVTDPTGTSGNISADPKLADVTAYGNMHIQPDSPCKDAGDDTVVETGWLDIDGQSRIQGSYVDIGADESDGTLWPAGPYVIVRVSPEGNDANDGSSWSLSKRTVQAGINAASELGGEVWVRAGTYLERITLLPYAHVYGGFAGTENARQERDWITHPTILDAQQGGSVVTALAGFQVSTIDGFTIRNGTGTLSALYLYGGGIYCSSSSPTIANNTITGNSARYGGGIYCSSSSATIANNAITANSASSSGGGIYCSGGSPMIANNTVTANRASSTGGGIYSSSSASSPTIINTIIAFNSSGIYKNASGPLTLRHNCVYGNTAYNYSGVDDPTGSDGNISGDPLLARNPGPGSDGQWGTADDDYGNLRLQTGSPCMDAGDNAAIPAGVTADLDGHARVINCLVDMGAYEADFALPSPFAADFDYDCDVDGEDLAIFEACVSGASIPYDPDNLPLGCTLTPDGDGIIAADCDRDGDVDQADFGIFQRCYSGPDNPADPACSQ